MQHPRPGRQFGFVSRRRLRQALAAVGADMRHRGGDLVVDLGGDHVRVGRGGYGQVGMQRLLARMRRSTFPVEAFVAALYGEPEAR